MNTSTNTPAPVPELSEAIIIDWLRAKAATYGIEGLYLKIEGSPRDYASTCIARHTTDCHAFGCGKSFDDAVEMIRKDIKTTERVAAEKRAQAATLLAEADKLCPVAAPCGSESGVAS
jgi:hypothetical protein